jgi:hypothetical protein
LEALPYSWHRPGTSWKLLHTTIEDLTHLGIPSIQLTQTWHIFEALPYSWHRPGTSWKLFHTVDTDLAHLGSSSIQLTHLRGSSIKLTQT